MTSRDGSSTPAVPPIVLASTFTFPNTAAEASAAATRNAALYSRWGNPTVDALEVAVARLEGADFALATGSGMAAISLALLYAARQGGPLLVQEPVYGGTHELCRDIIAPMGGGARSVPVEALVAEAAGLAAGGAIYLEMPANPTNRVPDLPAIRAAAPGAFIVVDATFATPINLQPLAHGADLVVHSATKYLAGHHDVIAGVVAGPAALREPLWHLRKLLGPVLDPSAAYRVLRGLETLTLRVQHQCATAELLAHRLAGHAAVRAVHHPCLASHPDHAVAGRLLRAGGAIVSFEVDAPDRVADALRTIHIGPSLGGVRSLITWPAGVSHIGLAPEERARSGVSDALLRLSVGIEPPEALWADLAQALDAAV